VRKKRPHYLAFLSFPETVRRSFSTTNTVEAINGQLESCAATVAAIFIPRMS
jgi:transposase-like protein